MTGIPASMEHTTPKNQASEWQHYLQILTRRKWLLLWLCIVGAVAGYLLPNLSAEKYEASALILVRPSKNIEFTQSGSKEVLNAPIGLSQTETPGKTYIELARSYTVVERVVTLLDLAAEEPDSDDGLLDDLKTGLKDTVRAALQVLKYGRTFETDRFLETVEAVQEGLDLRTTLETYVFSINFEADDPEKAAAVVNTVAEVFMDYLVELNRRESHETRTYLEAELEKTYQELETAGRELEAFKDRYATFSPHDEFREQLKILAELELDYEENGASLASTLKKLSASHPSIAALKGERAYLASAIKERRAVLEKLPAAEKELRLLELRIETATDAHEFLRKKHQEVQIREARSLPETVVVAPAVAPNNPSSPRYALSAVLSLFACFVVGLVMVFTLEYFDTSIRSVDDATAALDLPVLATVPPFPGDA